MTGVLRLTSWNIHGAVGADGRCDPGRILDAIRRLQPDILALQEIDGRTHFGRQERAFERFSAGLGCHVVEARTVPRPGRDYGHLLWSRWPIESSRVRPLPGGLVEKRFAIDAVLAVPGGPLRVLSTHFGLFGRDRRRQAEALRDWTAETDLPVLVLGDLNEWRLGGPVDAALSSALPTRLSPKSWPAGRPVARMDRIYASAGIELEAEAEDESLRRLSDHRALSAIVRLPIPS
ncbi:MULTISPECIES: endonuclease/exonuclease/phosphatase family protein [unclassified Aureimonas]|uniref:endonuclease/exonuclease/phosphatase family protein n=1 Tax=unclassified Aureimonas TaxID=2615206 RepID=UPI0006F37161|nr:MULTISPECIES: endonuclease/exonuclease/phosphatase family protein [unclassified Aureimonas]KQT60656.1 hypothetical protein ASG54_24670 [Aureimonas sp. Leaf460]KQT68785.1 hypothetical protein ASG62_18190 [Aureimonas sp. Leaf427]